MRSNQKPNVELLKVISVTKNFASLTALNDLNLSVREGELRSIIGPNGAGKTTLFNILTGHLRATKGRTEFKGEEITHLSCYEIARRGISRSFQITNIFPNLSIFENVRLAVQSKDKRSFRFFCPASGVEEINEKTYKILESVRLQGKSSLLGAMLSYGEQRHLEIAVALAIDPILLLLDEPTSGMSPGETRETIDLIRKVTKGITTILIEHDMEVVFSLSDTITVMYHGNKIAEDVPEKIERDQKVQDAYLGGLKW